MEDDFLSEMERRVIAMRMLRFEARNSTIHQATHLSAHDIRALYQHYRERHPASRLIRQRGRSPSQILQYTRSGPMQLETAIFAALLLRHGLLKGRRPKPWLDNTLIHAQRFCDAYAEYLLQAQDEPLNFEQAWQFAKLLAAREQIKLQRCTRCHSHFVRDVIGLKRRDCPLCRLRIEMLPPLVTAASLP